MHLKDNIYKFPSVRSSKENKYINIRDEVEKFLTNYAVERKDLWAVALAAGRFSSMTLEKIDGTDKTMDFFKNCIKTQREADLGGDSADIT